jgi:hypothetical protein
VNEDPPLKMDSIVTFGRKYVTSPFSDKPPENQCNFIFVKNSLVTGKSEPDPITESMPHIGHNAVSQKFIDASACEPTQAVILIG